MLIDHPINQSNNYISGWYINTTLWDEILLECNKRKILFEREPSGWRGYSSVYLDLISKEAHTAYKAILDTCLEQYKSQYPFLKDCPSLKYQNKDSNISTFKIQKYKPGKYYSELHCENDGKYPYRVLAFMTYLNDIDGGGTSFPSQNFQTKSEKGLTLIWPASFTHPHIGIPATDDTKIIITGWWEWDQKTLL